MAEITFQKGEVKSLKVTSITLNVKSVRKGNDIMQRHDIYLEDDKGNTSRCEFLNHSLECREFVPGVKQFVKCLWPDPKGSTIEPFDPEAHIPYTVSQAPKGTAATPIPGINQDVQLPPQIAHAINQDANVGGKAIVFAYAYAKDLKVAEIGRRKTGARVTEEDVDDMIRWAKEIRMAMLDFDAY